MCMSAQDVWEGGGKRYRMEKVVGNGAFGVVWRAREENSDVPVAIKRWCWTLGTRIASWKCCAS